LDENTALKPIATAKNPVSLVGGAGSQKPGFLPRRRVKTHSNGQKPGFFGFDTIAPSLN
jgi:hypothetical protein